MKNGAKEIIGRTVANVIIKEARGTSNPCSLVLLGFTDGTWFEFYSNGYISPTAGVSRMPMENYLSASHEAVFYAMQESSANDAHCGDSTAGSPREAAGD